MEGEPERSAPERQRGAPARSASAERQRGAPARSASAERLLLLSQRPRADGPDYRSPEARLPAGPRGCPFRPVCPAATATQTMIMWISQLIRCGIHMKKRNPCRSRRPQHAGTACPPAHHPHGHQAALSSRHCGARRTGCYRTGLRAGESRATRQLLSRPSSVYVAGGRGRRLEVAAGGGYAGRFLLLSELRRDARSSARCVPWTPASWSSWVRQEKPSARTVAPSPAARTAGRSAVSATATETS